MAGGCQAEAQRCWSDIRQRRTKWREGWEEEEEEEEGGAGWEEEEEEDEWCRHGLSVSIGLSLSSFLLHLRLSVSLSAFPLFSLSFISVSIFVFFYRLCLPHFTSLFFGLSFNSSRPLLLSVYSLLSSWFSCLQSLVFCLPVVPLTLSPFSLSVLVPLTVFSLVSESFPRCQSSFLLSFSFSSRLFQSVSFCFFAHALVSFVYLPFLSPLPFVSAS